MDKAELDTLKLNFSNSLQLWVAKIQRLRQILEETGYSTRAEDVWKQADFDVAEAEDAVKKSRQAYEDAIREANFHF